MKNVGYVMAFAVGVATGSLTTWHLLREKYKKLAQEEIDSVKIAFSRNRATESKTEDSNVHDDSAPDDSDPENNKPDVVEYARQIHGLGYTKYAGSSEGESEEEQPPLVTDRVTTDNTRPPYIITPEQFGEFDDYERVTLWFYSDHILADENEEVIEDVDDIIGAESLNHFGEYDDDSVYVRNDRLKIDYEVLLDLRTHAEVVKSRPYLRREEE